MSEPVNHEEKNQKTIIRKGVKRGNFVIIDKTALHDMNLSLKAKGLFSIIMALPDDWQINLQELARRSKDGIDSVRSAINELKKAGYCKMECIRNTYGRIEKWEYKFYEMPQNNRVEAADRESPTNTPKLPPQTDFPDMAFPDVVCPDMENPMLLNNNNTLRNKRTNNTIPYGIESIPAKEPEIDGSGSADSVKSLDKKKIYNDIFKQIDTVIEKWNEFADRHNLPKSKYPTPGLRQKITKRLREKNFDIDKILAEAADSEFLLTKFKNFNLRWIVKNEENYIKILEQNYKNQKNGGSATEMKEINKQAFEFCGLVRQKINTFSIDGFVKAYSDKYPSEFLNYIKTKWSELQRQNEFEFKRSMQTVLSDIENIAKKAGVKK